MKKQDIYNLIIENLQETMSKHGFKPVLKEAYFIRTSQGIAQKIIIPLYDYDPEYIFSFCFCIRFDKIENIFYEILNTPAAHGDKACTSLTPLEYFSDNKEFKVTNKEELQDAILSFNQIFNSKILPFFEEYSDMCELEKKFNSKDTSFQIINIPDTYIHGLILAKICNNPDFKTLAATYTTIVEPYIQEKEKLFKAIEYLQKL